VSAPKPFPKPGVGKGVLHPAAAAGKFEVARFAPSQELAHCVEHYWTVRWHLAPGERFEQETLPYPSLHLVIEHGRSELVGVPTAKFRRVLEGEGRVFAAKFLPGAAQPLFGGEVSRFNGRHVPLSEVLDVDVTALEHDVLDQRDDLSRAAALEEHVRALSPKRDARARLATRIVAEIEADPTLNQVKTLAERRGTSARTLERLLRRYVGVGPKWIIARFRLQEASEALAAGEDICQLALRLGYADQAHFTRAFRTLVGEPPATYAQKNRR
jgi:AraC-like DNA-binding protein